MQRFEAIILLIGADSNSQSPPRLRIAYSRDFSVVPLTRNQRRRNEEFSVVVAYNLVTVYGKDQRDDLSAGDKKLYRELARILKDESRRARNA